MCKTVSSEETRAEKILWQEQEQQEEKQEQEEEQQRSHTHPADSHSRANCPGVLTATENILPSVALRTKLLKFWSIS